MVAYDGLEASEVWVEIRLTDQDGSCLRLIAAEVVCATKTIWRHLALAWVLKWERETGSQRANGPSGSSTWSRCSSTRPEIREQSYLTA